MQGRSLFPLEIDKWDSNFFKVKIARLRISQKMARGDFSAQMSRLLLLARKNKADFLVVKLACKNPSYGRVLAGFGFKKYSESVDLVFKYPARADRKLVCGCKLRLLSSRDRPAVRNIAKDAFRLSYFYKCGFAKEEVVGAYHSQWAQNFSRDRNSKVFVAEKDKKVVGFIALRLDKRKNSARIILVAVDKCYRGLGIGSALVGKCINWGRKGLKEIFVMTQGDNRMALALYRRMGFKAIGREKVFCIKL